ncbi:MAG: cysteine--tRNA ligase [Candidatus Marinimicrobia bacterium]|nr:cysteine--tRNA ligase [Candidatus Neomarinimicrobiota bacterium]
MKLKLYNTLTKKIEKFKPLKTDYVRQYDCGPTVYWYAHIGNLWRYVISDLLRRVLEYNGYQVKQVMNITDVGHLTEADLAADTGEDKMAVAAKREKKTPEQIAAFYTRAFFKDTQRLNFLRPQVIPQATKHIKPMIELVKKLEKKGYAYWAGEKYFVFDIDKFKNYGQLSGKNLAELRSGARLEAVPGKKNPFDFALWIKDPKHLMHWDSPWGKGYPGWHLECSAMSMQYLGPTLDIHTGGEDNIFPHHENEIAQSEAATGKKFVRYWLHVRQNLVNGVKMSKSKGNVYLIQDLIDKGYDPLAFRYLCLTVHYQKNLNFNWDSLASAQRTLNKLREQVSQWPQGKKSLPRYEKDFLKAINANLDLPQALAVVWDLVKSNSPESEKKATLLQFDRVLGLGLKEYQPKAPSTRVKALVKEREKWRKQKAWQKADEVRQAIEKLGWLVEDTDQGSKLKPV